jgi:hypothetical protein
MHLCFLSKATFIFQQFFFRSYAKKYCEAGSISISVINDSIFLFRDVFANGWNCEIIRGMEGHLALTIDKLKGIVLFHL